MGTSMLKSGSFANQRRSQRILLSAPLQVSGRYPDGSTFAKEASTLVVNAHVCLILLKAPVSAGQLLRIKNLSTTEELSCVAMDINLGAKGVQEVGAGFAQANASF